MNALRMEGIQKRFGAKEVLKGVALTIPEHTVYGFLGPNGAGKTTTLKLILGLLAPDAGRMEVFGRPVAYGSTHRSLGYLPDVPSFYDYMTPMEYLRLCGEAAGLPGPRIRESSAALLEMVGLSTEKGRIHGFSRGMKQRLGIAQALLHEPRLLICDEPTSALDPTGRKEVLDILSRLRERTTVLFSTHILSDAERICDRVAVLHKGRTVLDGPLEELKRHGRRDALDVRFADAASCGRVLEAPALTAYRAQATAESRRLTLRAPSLEPLRAALVEACVQARVYPERLETLEPSLENLFLEVVEVAG